MEELTIMCIGDIHFKKTNVPQSQELASACLEAVKEKRPDVVVLLGDILDRFEDVKTTLLKSAIDFMDQLSRIVKLYVCVGNHDYPNNSVFLSEIHPFTALKLWGERITIVDHIIVDTIKGHRLCFSPYVAVGRFTEALTTNPEWSKCEAIFCHQEFAGCKMGAILSTNGDVWDESLPRIISGHIHDYQTPQSNILYVGCPMQHSFGDRGRKTISLVKLSDEFEEERLDLKLPRMEIIYIEASEIMNAIVTTNKILKIVIRGTVAENLAAKKHSNISMWKKMGFKVVFKDEVRDKTEQRSIYRAGLSFSEAVVNELADDEELLTLFQNLFKY